MPHTIETPFGTAEVRDARYYTDGPNDPAAYIYMESATINRKEYRSLRLKVIRPGRYGKSWAVISDQGYFSELTDSARSKVYAEFQSEKYAETFAPYFEELSAAEKRAQLKSHLSSRVGHALTGLIDNGTGHRDLIPEVLDEVLLEYLEARAKGKTYSDIYVGR